MKKKEKEKRTSEEKKKEKSLSRALECTQKHWSQKGEKKNKPNSICPPTTCFASRRLVRARTRYVEAFRRTSDGSRPTRVSRATSRWCLKRDAGRLPLAAMALSSLQSPLLPPPPTLLLRHRRLLPHLSAASPELQAIPCCLLRTSTRLMCPSSRKTATRTSFW